MKKCLLIFSILCFFLYSCNIKSSTKTTTVKSTTKLITTTNYKTSTKTITMPRTDSIKIIKNVLAPGENDFILSYFKVSEENLNNFSFYTEELKNFVDETNYHQYYVIFACLEGEDYIWLYPTHKYDPNDDKLEKLSKNIKVKSNLSFTFESVLALFKERFDLSFNNKDAKIVTIYNDSGDIIYNEFAVNRLLTFVLEKDNVYYSLIYNDVTNEVN